MKRASVTSGRLLPYAGILWFGCMAGFFFAFSAVVMPGLELTEPRASLAAMQDINSAVRSPLFGIGFFGAAAIAVLLALRPLASSGPKDHLAVAAALLYLIGTFGVTVLGNVPLNEALAVIDRSVEPAAGTMSDYLRRWNDLNHVRTLSALVATGILAWRFGRPRPMAG